MIDPITGIDDGKGDGKGSGGDLPNTVSIPKEEWEGIKSRLDSFDMSGAGRNQFQGPAPQLGPTLDDQLAALETKIREFDSQIDEAVKNGDPVAALLRKRDTLSRESIRLEIKGRDIDPALGEGIGVIEQISSEMSRSKMPHYELVKKDMEKHLAALPANQRMNPQVRQAAYSMAVGQNVEKIMQSEQEKLQRQAAAQALDTGAGGRNSRNGASPTPGVPLPKDVLGTEALKALKMKGVSVDQHYQNMGYKGGWPEYWEKTGRDYFGEQEED